LVDTTVGQFSYTRFDRRSERRGVPAAGLEPGRPGKVSKKALLAEIYAAAQQSIGVPVALDGAAIAIFRLVLEQYLALNRLRSHRQTGCDPLGR
jgi:hypothetical protein